MLCGHRKPSLEHAPGGARSLGSPLQPQGRGTIAVVEAVVGSKVLHIRLPGGGDRVRVQVHIVLLLCYIALNVEDELLARLQVLALSQITENRKVETRKSLIF